MCLTVASGLLLSRYWLQPPSHHFFFFFFFTAIQSTGNNCTHAEERTKQGTLTTQKDAFSSNTQSPSANANIDYQATAQILCIYKGAWRGKWKCLRRWQQEQLLLLLLLHHQWFTSTNPSTKPSEDRWRYSRHTVLQIKCFLSGWLKAHTHSASCWVAAETPPRCASLTEQRERQSYPGTSMPFTLRFMYLFCKLMLWTKKEI